MHAAVDTKDVYRGLKDKFLYSNDLNSIYILLTLYDVEENINNIYPKYMSLKEIKRKVLYILRNRADSENIAHNLSVMIHEDINRLELCFYLEGYKDGHKSVKCANILEKEIIKRHGIGFVYKKDNFKYVINDSSFDDVKSDCYALVDDLLEKDGHMRELTNEFLEKIVKKKIRNLDKLIQKQLRIEFDSERVRISEIDYRLSESEIRRIDASVLGTMVGHLEEVYKDAFWTAVNDKVFGRYK